MGLYFGEDASGNMSLQNVDPGQPPDYSTGAAVDTIEQQKKKKFLTDQQAAALKQSSMAGSNAAASAMAQARALMLGLEAKNAQYANEPDYSA